MIPYSGILCRFGLQTIVIIETLALAPNFKHPVLLMQIENRQLRKMPHGGLLNRRSFLVARKNRGHCAVIKRKPPSSVTAVCTRN